MSYLVGRTRTRIYSVVRLRISTISPKLKRLFLVQTKTVVLDLIFPDRTCTQYDQVRLHIQYNLV